AGARPRRLLAPPTLATLPVSSRSMGIGPPLCRPVIPRFLLPSMEISLGENLMRPFEGIKILDCTHVLAGPFAAYQLAVLGADVIKVDDPNEPDQSRESGADHTLNQAMMGTGFLTQGTNKRAIALDLKTEGGRDALK